MEAFMKKTALLLTGILGIALVFGTMLAKQACGAIGRRSVLSLFIIEENMLCKNENRQLQ
jgi:hypothetical protein